MKRIILLPRYIRHFLEANSRHGTHSPFVYALAEQVIYKRSAYRDEKVKGYKGLLHEIAEYFSVTYSFDPSVSSEDKALWLRDGRISVDVLALLQHQFRYVVIENIHNSAKDRARWNILQRDSRFVVTIDLFFFGLLFYRTEQPKQHFKLRYPFWKYV